MIDSLLPRLESLKQKNAADLALSGLDEIRHEVYLNLRYSGTDTSLMVRQQSNDVTLFQQGFTDLHQQEFGFNF